MVEGSGSGVDGEVGARTRRQWRPTSGRHVPHGFRSKDFRGGPVLQNPRSRQCVCGGWQRACEQWRLQSVVDDSGHRVLGVGADGEGAAMKVVLLLVGLAGVIFAQTLVTSDIDNFWKAYDASQPGQREEAFDKLYLGPGSPGLQDFVKLRIRSAKALAAAVDQKYPKFYASVRPYTLEVGKQAPTILKYLDRYKELYREAHFQTVYFVIGRLTSGGTVSDRGLLIGTEVNSLGKDVDTSEINPAFRHAMGPVERISLIVIHELTHTQAKQAASSNVAPMLAQCIGEGAADFMTELVAKSSINAYSKEWADARRDELFQRFAR